MNKQESEQLLKKYEYFMRFGEISVFNDESLEV